MAAPSLDPQEALAKQTAITQAGAKQDEATIKRIEAQIANSNMGWLQAQFAEVSSRESSERADVNKGLSDHQSTISKSAKDAPKDAGPAPNLGNPTRPAVSTGSGTKGGDVKASGGTKTGGGGGPTSFKIPGKSFSPSAMPALDGSPGGFAAAFAATGGGEGELDGFLNGYTPKGQQASQMLGRITQMKTIADGFSGQLDVYVSQGGALDNTIAATANFFKVGKDASAIFQQNPYAKIGGTLGMLMRTISNLKNATSIVGSICGKLGLILTVVGLLGMIFPPIGVAVSGIARVLNVIGLICDALSFVMSGVLTGLNGVSLAQQIKAGATAEEKAATADLLITEANATAGGLINMGMAFGPKFMKGLTSGSRGVLSSLVRRFRTVVGNVSLRLTGNIKNFANRIIRKLGFGGAKMNRVGGKWVAAPNIISKTKESLSKSWAGKAYTSAPKVIDKMQDWTMKKWGNKAWAKRLDRIGTRSGAWADKWDPDKFVGKLGEGSGKFVGKWGSNTDFGKKLAKGADAAERESREMAMKLAQKDAMHLEQTRWQNHLAEQSKKRQAGGGSAFDPVAQDKFIAKKVGDVEKKHAHDFGRNERKFQANEAQALRKEAADKKMNSDFRNDKEYREDFMGELHDSRERRWKLETKFADKDKERQRLTGLKARTPDEQGALDRLNRELAILDRSRATNLGREAKANKLAGFKNREVHNWHDVYENTSSAVLSAAEMLHLRDEEAAWRKAEKANLRKQVAWKKGAGAGGVSRGGSSIYGEIRTNAWHSEMADFAAFVAQGRPTPSTAATVRTMLSSINRPSTGATTTGASAQTQTQTQTQTPNQTQQPANTTPTATPSVQSTPGANPSQTSQTTPTQESPQQATGPDPVADADADEGGSEALPYWPSLLQDFDKAMTDFGFMRKVATEFKRAQIVGKQKAVDTLAIYGRYQEYAKLRTEHAKKNAVESTHSQQETQENASAAGTSASHAATGDAKQNEARGASNNRAATDLPEPETRGFWGRILGAMKRWAKAKAAALFGWIQEKVASAVMKGLCGVSMGDMRDYANALRNQQMRAHGVAGNAAATSGKAEATTIKLGADATKEAQSAANAIGECDKNIVEADGFISDVTSFETQLTQEKAHAQVFLAQVHAAVNAEKERRRAEQEAQAAQQSQDPTQMSQAGDEENMSTDPGMSEETGEGADGGADGDDDGVPDGAETDAARAQIHAAAGYVSDTVAQMRIQVQGRAEDYTNQLALAMTNRTGDGANGQDLVQPAKRQARELLASFDEFVAGTRQNMDGVRSMVVDASSAAELSDRVIQAAVQADEHYEMSLDALDQLFESTYVGIREGERDLKTRIYGEGTMLGGVNEAVMNANDRAYETVNPVLNTAWSGATDPVLKQESLLNTNNAEEVQKAIDANRLAPFDSSLSGAPTSSGAHGAPSGT